VTLMGVKSQPPKRGQFSAAVSRDLLRRVWHDEFHWVSGQIDERRYELGKALPKPAGDPVQPGTRIP
jgi:hypothetical protein